MVEWWLKKGIDGFRFDAIHLIGKPPGAPDYKRKPEEPEWANHYRNTPLGHEYLRELNDRVLSRYRPVTVGETGGATVESAALYVNKDRHEFDMIFHCGFLEQGEDAETSAAYLKKSYQHWFDHLSENGWDAVFLGNHDLPRQVSLYGDDKKYWKQSAKLLATLILTQCGTPFLFQGEEIGMTNAGFKRIDQFRDPHTVSRYDLAEGKKGKKKVLKQIIAWGRDNSRTPMQWDRSSMGGFTRGTPWIGMADNWKKINVERQENDPDSVLNYYKAAITLRKENKALAYGNMKILDSSDSLIAYSRCFEKRGILVVLNFSSEQGELEPLPPYGWIKLHLLLGNYKKASTRGLRPWEARVYQIGKEDLSTRNE